MNPGLLILLGAGAYLLYKMQTTPPVTGELPPLPTSGPSPAPGPVALPPVTPSAPSAATIKAKMIQAMTAGGVPMSGGDFTGTPWGFNWWLNQVAGVQIADMGAAFPGCGTGVQGGCDTSNISFAQFWSQAVPYLQKQGSLSGIGRYPLPSGGFRVRIPVTMSQGWR